MSTSHILLLEHMCQKFEINWTKIKGSCQSGRKVVTQDSKSDLPLGKCCTLITLSPVLPALVLSSLPTNWIAWGYDFFLKKLIGTWYESWQIVSAEWAFFRSRPQSYVLTARVNNKLWRCYLIYLVVSRSHSSVACPATFGVIITYVTRDDTDWPCSTALTEPIYL